MTLERFFGLAARHSLRAFGARTRAVSRKSQGLVRFVRDLAEFRRQAAASALQFDLGRLHPCLDEFAAEAGGASGAYFHQDLWVAQRVFATNPKRHIDVGSRVDGFVAHVATFRTIEVLDVRPLRQSHPAIQFRQTDLMDPSSVERACCDSLSCLHALEHFGLGRYGDPIDYEGHLKGWTSLTKMLQPGGLLHFSVPIGPARIEFNAHRVFSIRMVLELAREHFDLESFSFVDDRGDFHPNVPADDSLIASNAGCTYGCGIFEFRRRR